MGDKSKVLSNQDTFNSLQREVERKLQATTYSYNNGDQFYREYADSFAQLISTFETLQNYCQNNLTKYHTEQQEAIAKAAKDKDISEKSDDFIRAKTEDLIKKNKVLDEIKNQMKTPLSEIKPAALAKLPADKMPGLNSLFSTIFQLFYKDAKDAFEWKKFSTVAIKKNYDDFQNRLVNTDYAEIPSDQLATLSAFKDNAELKDFSTNKKEGESVFKLLSYLHYVGEINKNQLEIARLQEEIARIRADAPKRKENAKTEAEWAEGLKINISHLDSINARIAKAIEPYSNGAETTDALVDSYEQHKKNLKNQITQEYLRVAQVPEGVYKV